MTPDRTPCQSLVPSWARPYIPSAIGSGLLVVACIVGAYCLAAVL